MKKKEKKQEIKWNKNFSRTILLAFRDNPSLARAIAAFNRETRINAGYGIRAKPYDQITPFLRCSTRQNVATRATDRMCSELIYARDPFNRASPTVDVEMSARLPHFCPFRPIREYIFSRTCPKRYFSSYLDRSISRFEESVSFDSQSRRFFFIDERQVWEIRSFFLIWESIFNWIHQWINIDHLSMHEWKLSSKVLFSNAFVERCSTSSGSLLKISFRIFSHSIRNKRC